MFTKNSSFLVLYTRNIAKTYDFYHNVGATISQHEKDKVVLTIGDFEIHFILYTSEPFREYQYIANSVSYGHGMILYIKTDDIEGLHTTIPTFGGTVKSPILTNHWQAKEFLFEDPNGYTFAAYSKT